MEILSGLAFAGQVLNKKNNNNKKANENITRKYRDAEPNAENIYSSNNMKRFYKNACSLVLAGMLSVLMVTTVSAQRGFHGGGGGDPARDDGGRGGGISIDSGPSLCAHT